MALSRPHGTPSPSSSSIFLPLGRRSRRGSRASISTQVDKETLDLALDQIHTQACQSDSLTVFNEYTSPPAASTTTENKGLTGDLQGGLSGLYNRFRASMGGAADVATAPGKDDTKTPGADGAANVPSKNTPQAKLNAGATKTTDLNSSLPGSAQTSTLQSPVSESFSNLTDSQVHAPKPFKVSSNAASIASKASVPPTPTTKSPAGQLARVSTSATAEPAVVELTVNAVRDPFHHVRGSSGNTFPNTQNTRDSAIAEPEPSPLTRPDSVTPDSPLSFVGDSASSPTVEGHGLGSKTKFVTLLVRGVPLRRVLLTGRELRACHEGAPALHQVTPGI